MNRGHRRVALLVAALGAAALSAGALVPPGAGAAAPESRVVLPQAAPSIPADAARLGWAPSGQVLTLDVVLAGQDPAGLAQAVAAVSTPGSPDYRHYLTAAQYAAAVRSEPGRSGASVLGPARPGARGRDSGPGQHVAPGERHGRRRLRGVRDAARVGPGTEPGEGAREHRITAGPGISRRGGDRCGRPGRSVPGALHVAAQCRPFHSRQRRHHDPGHRAGRGPRPGRTPPRRRPAPPRQPPPAPRPASTRRPRCPRSSG